MLRVEHSRTVVVLQSVPNAVAIPVVCHMTTIVYLTGCVLQNLGTEKDSVRQRVKKYGKYYRIRSWLSFPFNGPAS